MNDNELSIGVYILFQFVGWGIFSIGVVLTALAHKFFTKKDHETRQDIPR